MGELGIDQPISLFIRFGQSRAIDQIIDAEMIQFLPMSGQTVDSIAEAFSPRELSKSHREKLDPTSEASDFEVAIVPNNAFVKFVSW